GNFIRRVRLDELPQLVNVLKGEMSFVGTRPEEPRYTEQYSPEMMATLLFQAGITSPASINYKDDDTIISQIPEKGLSVD
ncbi:sugar transferase, partial [Streptococcus pneumoniae]|uniref:sugar transferase n=1 Tax=Streptococcus pneumoniae TaxID=1313 RepID=UPI0035B955C7